MARPKSHSDLLGEPSAPAQTTWTEKVGRKDGSPMSRQGAVVRSDWELGWHREQASIHTPRSKARRQMELKSRSGWRVGAESKGLKDISEPDCTGTRQRQKGREGTPPIRRQDGY